MSEWQSIETAPKDNTIILDVGYPWPVVGYYSDHQRKWVYAQLNLDLFSDDERAGEVDAYFENEVEEYPIGWMPMPKIERDL